MAEDWNMYIIKRLGTLPKGAKFLDPWGNQWQKISKKSDAKIVARIGKFETEFPDEECYICSREEALADLRIRLKNAPNIAAKKQAESLIEQMNSTPYETLRAALWRLLDRSGMSFNGRSVDVAEGIRNILKFYPKLPRDLAGG